MDLEALNQIVELYVHAGDLGEAIWSRIEFWSGISFGAIALAYLAPARLTPSITALIVLLYTLFCVSLYINLEQDILKIEAILADINTIADKYAVDSQIVDQVATLRIREGFSILEQLALLYITGLFVSTIGFLIWTSYQVKRREYANDS